MMTHNTLVAGMVVLSIVGLAGCGSSSSNPTNSDTNQEATNTANTVQQSKSNTTGKVSQTSAFTAEQQVQDIYRALQGIPTTPKAYVDAYLEAISTRSGSLARGYLAPSIRSQIPARIIGSSKWIGKWTIIQTSSANGRYNFNVTAYQYFPPATKDAKGSWMEAFKDKVTVQSEGYQHSHEPWIITSQQIQFRKYLGF